MNEKINTRQKVISVAVALFVIFSLTLVVVNVNNDSTASYSNFFHSTAMSDAHQNKSPGPFVIKGSGGGGGGSSGSTTTYETVSVDVFNSNGYVTIGSSNLYNGDSINLVQYDTYSISFHSTNSNYAFEEWASSAGSISNTLQSSTSLYVTSSGILSPVLNRTVNSLSWSGYVICGGITSASSNILMPSNVKWSPDKHFPIESISPWVGIGGYFDSDGSQLWQAGVDINVTNTTGLSSTVTMTPWYEYIVESSTGNIVQNILKWNDDFQISEGDIVSVHVWISGSSSYFTIEDKTIGDQWSGSVPYLPSENSADYILETTYWYTGSSGVSAEPDYGTINFDSVSSNIGTLLYGPSMLWDSACTANNYYQYNYPGYIYSNGNYNSFYMEYE